MLENFYTFLESVFEWFFGATILQDTFISWLVKVIEFGYGCWLLYIFLVKPIYYIIRVIDNKIYFDK